MKRKVMKKLSIIFLVMVMLTLVACGGNTKSSNSSNTSSNSSNTSNTGSTNNSAGGSSGGSSDGPIKVTLWHYMGGGLGEAINMLVENFNASRSDIQVEAIYQGTYDEALNKMKASMDSKSGPTIMHANDGGTRYMVDSGAITPMQQFIDADNFDLSQFEENILAYYTLDGRLNSMPFNTSNLIMYYNKDMFRKAGLDPEKPPTTFDEMKKIGQILTKDGVTGISFAIESWNLEQLLANQGAEFVNNGNGRDAPATASVINSEAAVQTVAWWKDLLDSKVAVNLGRKADDVRKAFSAEQVAIIFSTTASLRALVTSAEGKFEVGTAFLPKPDNAKPGGVVVGGGSLYILNNRPEAEQKAAFEFIKFLVSPEQQALWHVNTGYFPVTKAAYDQQIVKDNMEKYPQFKTAIDQLHATTLNRATQGAVIGVFPEARQITETALEDALSGQKSIQDALDQAAKEITAKIEIYNKTVKK
jgi:sn-glycerol 3-phosphate transport system substrate-binding protein